VRGSVERVGFGHAGHEHVAASTDRGEHVGPELVRRGRRGRCTRGRSRRRCET
jgi:hypothetical protein